MGGFVLDCHTQTFVEVAKLELKMDNKFRRPRVSKWEKTVVLFRLNTRKKTESASRACLNGLAGIAHQSGFWSNSTKQ